MKQSINNLPHLLPTSTGQLACLVKYSPSPEVFKLYQKAAVPFLGGILIFKLGKTVAPPFSTSLNYKMIN